MASKNNPFYVEFKKRGKPKWVPATKERPGYWIPSFPRVYLGCQGLGVVFPEQANEKKAAINSAIDRAIAFLEELRK